MGNSLYLMAQTKLGVPFNEAHKGGTLIWYVRGFL
jgi:hypothetical protein